jgi:hypothetical protein
MLHGSAVLCIFNGICIMIQSTTMKSIVAVLIFFCIHASAQVPENTLAKLKDQECLRIAYQTNGCFYQDTLSIIITCRAGRLEAGFYANAPAYGDPSQQIQGAVKKGTLVRSKYLTASDIRAFIQFENELRKFSGDLAFCTTRDHYTIHSRYWNAELTDGLCQWNGFYTLEAAWFGKPFAECLF